MERCVEPELLDALVPDDPRAVGSRRDLQKVNASMGNGRILVHGLRSALKHPGPSRIVEIGAGDGCFALGIARRLARGGKPAEFVLVDRLNAMPSEARAEFERLGGTVKFLVADVFDWLREPPAKPCDAIVANLFLHHFSEAQLTALFQQVSLRTGLFIAVEPRRSQWCLRFSQWLWVLGCNQVTRHDAQVSVRAGFAGRELSRLWPVTPGWNLEERAAGLFSHLFVARRKD